MLARVRMEVDANRLWRAKEILHSNLVRYGLDVELCERYGCILHQLGDELEAGKYLFLSGVRKPEYEPPINLFVRRHGRKDPMNIYRAFPPNMKLATISAYPEAVVRDMKALGLPEELSAYLRPPMPPRNALAASAIAIGCFLVFGVAVICALIGAGQMLKWIAGG
jgi:hypothetical protein